MPRNRKGCEALKSPMNKRERHSLCLLIWWQNNIVTSMLNYQLCDCEVKISRFHHFTDFRFVLDWSDIKVDGRQYGPFFKPSCEPVSQ